jgi:hypothetical protein
MISWFSHTTNSFWSSVVASFVGTLDDVDRVWEPFLTDDDLVVTDSHPLG